MMRTLGKSRWFVPSDHSTSKNPATHNNNYFKKISMKDALPMALRTRAIDDFPKQIISTDHSKSTISTQKLTPSSNYAAPTSCCMLLLNCLSCQKVTSSCWSKTNNLDFEKVPLELYIFRMVLSICWERERDCKICQRRRSKNIGGEEELSSEARKTRSMGRTWFHKKRIQSQHYFDRT